MDPILPPASICTSCGPRYGCAVLFGFHAQSCDTRRLAVGVHVEIVCVDARGHARRSTKQPAHVGLSHVTPRTGHAQKIRHPAGRVGVRSHAGGHGVAGHDAAGYRRRRAAAADPGGVLDLKSALVKRRHSHVQFKWSSLRVQSRWMQDNEKIKTQ